MVLGTLHPFWTEVNFPCDHLACVCVRSGSGAGPKEMIIIDGGETGSPCWGTGRWLEGTTRFLVSFFVAERPESTREEVTFPRSQRVGWKHIWDQEQESDSELSCSHSVMLSLH